MDDKKQKKEYIEREALIENVKRVYCTDCNSYNGVRCKACGTGDTLDVIEDAPAADVAPRAEVELWKGRVEAAFAAIPKTRREFAREIFADIENVLNREYTEIEQRRARIKDPDALDSIDGELCGLDYALQLVTECKEKYTGATDTKGGAE